MDIPLSDSWGISKKPPNVFGSFRDDMSAQACGLPIRRWVNAMR
jgi:hypothetical protein